MWKKINAESVTNVLLPLYSSLCVCLRNDRLKFFTFYTRLDVSLIKSRLKSNFFWAIFFNWRSVIKWRFISSKSKKHFSNNRVFSKKDRTQGSVEARVSISRSIQKIELCSLDHERILFLYICEHDSHLYASLLHYLRYKLRSKSCSDAFFQRVVSRFPYG